MTCSSKDSLRESFVMMPLLLFKCLVKIGAAAVPSPIQQCLGWTDTAPERVISTSYLNGLRGVASLFVVVRHYSQPWQKGMDFGYGHDDRFWGVFRLPFLRLLYAGPSVAIFFVISAYVLSLKPLRLAKEQSFDRLLISLSTSVFTRAFRIFLPPLTMTFAVMLAVRLGWYNFPYEVMPGRHPNHPQVFASWWLQLENWLTSVIFDLTNPWDWNTRASDYGSYLWTISIQFRGSMVLFLTILGLARVRTRLQPIILSALFGYCMVMSRWDAALFVGGLAMALRDVTTSETQIILEDRKDDVLARYKQNGLQKACYVGALLLGLYVASFPRSSRNCDVHGFVYMCHISANYRIWYSVGALLIVFAISRLEFLQRPLSSQLALYLGNISFSVYIVHVPVLHLFGFSIVPFMWKLTGNDSALRYQLGFISGLLPLFLTVWVAADAFWRLIDSPCAKLTRWISTASLVS